MIRPHDVDGRYLNKKVNKVDGIKCDGTSIGSNGTDPSVPTVQQRHRSKRTNGVRTRGELGKADADVSNVRTL